MEENKVKKSNLDELYNTLYLYKNQDIYLTAGIATETIYEIIKNYIKENNNE